MTRSTSARAALVLLLAGVVALAVLYGWIAATQPEIGGIDARVLDLAAGAELPGSPPVLSSFSSGTDTEPLLVATIIVGVGAWMGGARRAGLVFWAVSGFSSLAVTVLKRLADRTRPPLGQVVETSAAWPSGHSAGAMIFAVGAALVMWRADRSAARVLAFMLVPAALAVGYSRAFLELHWASDVVAGWLVAGVAATGFLMFDSPVESTDDTRPGWLYGAMALALLYLVGVGVSAPGLA